MCPSTLSAEHRLRLLAGLMHAATDRRWGMHYFGMASYLLVQGKDRIRLEFQDSHNANSVRTMFYAYRSDLRRNNSGAEFLSYLESIRLQTEDRYITFTCTPQTSETPV